MSKNLSDIFPPTEIGGGGGGGIEEAPRDGRMYARQEQQNTGMGWTAFDPGNLDPGTEDDQVLLWHTADDKWSASNTVPAVQSGPTPPFNPVEGTLWMEVPNQGEATMWVYTKDSGGNGRWLQHPGGKDGAPGADGNIADGTANGVIATWNSTDGQWKPEPALTFSSAGNATFSGTMACRIMNAEFMTIRGRNLYSDHFGVQLGATMAMLPVDNTGSVHSVAGTAWADIGSTAYPWKDAHFGGDVYSKGSPLTRTRDLIETLHTLREATKDETTIKGLRDAIGNAIGGLIEKFEAMQAETQEISDE